MVAGRALGIGLQVLAAGEAVDQQHVWSAVFIALVERHLRRFGGGEAAAEIGASMSAHRSGAVVTEDVPEQPALAVAL